MSARHLLFSYGILQLREVQLDTFGHVVESDADVLPGYTADYAEIDDDRVPGSPRHHILPVVRATGDPRDKVTGVVLHVTEAEMDAADEFEMARYRRVSATLGTGRTAWVYVTA
ncbi:gamma-glutamylcyclotransferase family protein [Microbacterium aquimaris]|uniref:gamma-glutamylcyclotransferase family protein n=1 Tax=Microbacterium aquimaris TaxID=459816 RepID=UPI002AD33B5F|nr:gamma-glutamylcyclotransferase family protein [Microbacterium aquimaris]MDZ8277039.1 gamma-glutamylcyclotransferase family protein [Microbacterium aquimaris]